MKISVRERQNYDNSHSKRGRKVIFSGGIDQTVTEDQVKKSERLDVVQDDNIIRKWDKESKRENQCPQTAKLP